MALYLAWQIWWRDNFAQGGSGVLIEPYSSGTLPIGSTVSAPIPVPDNADEGRLLPSVVVRVIATAGEQTPAFVEIRETGTPTSTGQPASPDASFRMLLRDADGEVTVPVPGGGSFAVVQAAL